MRTLPLIAALSYLLGSIPFGYLLVRTFRGEDVRRPIVVTKGQTVTMQFIVPGVELTAMGRAMSEGFEENVQ